MKQTSHATSAVILCGMLLTAATPSALAEHFDILLTLRNSRGFTESSWDTSPPEEGKNGRPRFQALLGEPLELEWKVRSAYPHGVLKDAGVHIFVEPAGLMDSPAATRERARILETRLTADFLPQHVGRGHIKFRVKKPGNYLVRLQSENTALGQGHEHFSAIDLKVE